MSKGSEIIKLLAPYLLAWPLCKMNEGHLLIYSKALSCLELPEIEAAMKKLVLTSKFFPSVSEIFEQVEIMKQYIQEGNGGPRELTADEAWEEVMKLAKDVGPYREEKWTFSHPAVERACMEFGKMELCLLEVDAVNTARAQFMKIYKSIINRQKAERQNRMAVDAMPLSSVQALLDNVTAGMKQIE